MYTFSERLLNEREKQDQKLKRCMHPKKTLQRLAQQDDLFLEESITTAEDERTAMAKADKTDSRQKTIDQAHNKTNTKPTASIIQQARNTTYGICTAFKRTATRLLTNKKQVTFGNTTEQANTVNLTYDSGADGHYVVTAAESNPAPTGPR